MVGMAILLLASVLIATSGCCDDEEHKSCTFTEEVSTDNGRQDVTCKCKNRTDHGEIVCSTKIWGCTSWVDGEQVGKAGRLDTSRFDFDTAREIQSTCEKKGVRDEHTGSLSRGYFSSPSERCLNNLD